MSIRFWAGNDSANEECSMKDTVVRGILRAPCVPWNRAYRDACARKMPLLPMIRSLSVNQGCVQRDRFLNSLAAWGCLEHLVLAFLQRLLGRVNLQEALHGDGG